MKQTANTKLNQWEKSDRIMMSDFNSDNQKLDAALKSLAGDAAALRQSITALQTQLNQSTAALQARIDTLTARATPVVLKEMTFSQGGYPLALDVSFIDWDLYDRIIIDSKLISASTGAYMDFRDGVNDIILGYGYARLMGATTPIEINRLTIYSHGDKTRNLYVESISSSHDNLRGLKRLTGAELKIINVKSSHNELGVSPGCWFRISGVKA